MLYSLEARHPKINGENIFIAESAEVIGSVIIENNVCILPQVVVRGDNELIQIGEGTNIQDGAIIHTDPGIPMQIGSRVTIAHRATLHGCQVGDGSVIGIGAVVLNNAVIGKNCVIGANALILENENIPDGSFVVGMPAKIKGQLNAKQIEQLKWYAEHYIEKIAILKKLKKITQ